MEFEKVIYLAGKPGLYRVINKTNFGLVAESLSDGRRIPVYSSNRIVHLADISIFTTGEDNIPLADALLRLSEKLQGQPFSLDSLLNEDDFRSQFAEVIPEYDSARVYPSDIKKFFSWYNVLLSNNLLPKKEQKENPGKESNDSKTVQSPDIGLKNKAGRISEKPAQVKASAPSKSKGGAKVNTPRKAS